MLRMLPPRVRRVFRLDVRRPTWTEADVDTELRFHVAMRVEQLVAAGWARGDAEAEARRRFGASWDDAVRQLYQSGHAREERLAMRERLDSFWLDLRYAVRGLRRAPRYAAAAVLTLALGLGATTVIFSLVDHIVLRPLPYPDPERLVVIREVVGDLESVYPTMPANANHFLEWRRGCRACEGMAAIKRSAGTLTTDGDPQRLGAARVSASLFPMLGVRPALGRFFREEEDREGQEPVVVLGDGLWRRQFGADPSIVGRAITLSGVSHVVIGVLPPAGSLPGGDALGALVGLPRDVDFYRPLALSPREATATGEFDYAVVARLRPGATVAEARAQLDAIEADFAARAGAGATLRTAIVPLHEQIVGGVGRPLLLLLAAVGALLLIVCVNLTNLSLARSAGRQREAAVRVALGAGRGRLARMALAESLAVALAGGALGLLLAHWGLRGLLALAPATLPRLADVQLDGRVFAAAAFLTALVGVVVGALPAIGAGRAHPGDALRTGGRTMTSGRAAARRRAVFITAQVAFSTLLLIGTGLFLRSFVGVMRVDPGFDTERVIAFDVVLPGARYASEEQTEQFYARVLREVAAVPGVASTALTSAMPLEGESWVNGVTRAEDAAAGGEGPSSNYRFVSPGYFATVGTPLRRGRDIGSGDRGQHVVVLSDRTAQALWPGADPIGRRVDIGRFGTAEVVGIAADVRTSTLEQEGSLVVYLPSWENASWTGVIVVRTRGEPAAVAAAVRGAIRAVDPAVPVPKVRTTAQVVSATVDARRFQLAVIALFALMALVTASVGIYGVISQSLASRTGEIGVRMALGAQAAAIHRLVLREGLTPVALGLALGVAGSLAAGRAIESLLFEVRAADPLTIAGVGALLTVVALVACAIPARRATKVDLARMLRSE